MSRITQLSRITVLYYTTQAFGGSVNQDVLIEKKGAQEIPTKKGLLFILNLTIFILQQYVETVILLNKIPVV